MKMRKLHLAGLAVIAVLAAGAGTALATGGPQPGMGHGMMAGGGGGLVMDAAADYIGITDAQLMSDRHDGKSLAQIAVAHGKTVAGLKAAMTTAFRTSLDRAVAAGRMTSAQAARALERFQANLQAMVDRTATGPRQGGGRGMGPGGGSCPGHP